MKCVCGYEKDKDDFKKVKLFAETSKFVGNPYGGGLEKYTIIQEIYVCPKCGTLKIDI